ncbi:MAG: DNA mismatch repair endonuclease MutL [Candidatus Aureabacteria bacterium]|nr:DNA mismatch repair endonuclease MutL [Candidatus Auribacterota bacterium]
MNRIKVLDAKVISRIAAGEMIERASSVVKELIENSIDAGSTEIIVSIEDGGKKLILVQDNGTGIAEDDILLAIKRHATSKIQDDSDLFHIKSFGFRGEALPSIGSISRMTVTTSTDDTGLGSRIRIDFGKESKCEKTSHLKGTTIRIENIFENVPVRKKFLKSTSTEKRNIQIILDDFASAHPSITFQLRSNDSVLSHYKATDDPSMRYRELLGDDVFDDMKLLSFTTGTTKIYGAISIPTRILGNRSKIRFFVNKRPIIDNNLNFSLVKYYSDKIPKGNHPYALIFIDIDPESIDVNVHPTKKEIKFKNPNYIFSQLLKAYSLAFSGVSYNENNKNGASALFEPFMETKNFNKPYSGSIPAFLASTGVEDEKHKETFFSFQKSTDEEFRIIGQLGKGYIVLEDERGMQIIDQHAAHERIMYERLKKKYEQKQVTAQDLLIPDIVELDKKDFEVLNDNISGLQELGFAIVPFGESTFKIDTVPNELAGVDTKIFLSRYISEINLETPTSSTIKMEKVFRMACRSSVMAGDALSHQEMQMLVRDLFNTSNKHTCPHGRPIIKQFHWKELRSFFNRS